MTESTDPRLEAIDTTVAHPARRYNYWLGGKDHFAADRESGEEFAQRFPGVRIGARANRAMLQRATRHLTEAYGIRQFLDIGTGLPTADNTHEVAQRVAPESRVVYVDNDPLVMTHARALLTSTPEGRTAYLQADLREPDAILAEKALHQTIDLNEPVGLILVAVLHFIPGEGAAQPIVRKLLDRLAPGSFLVVTHATMDFAAPEHRAAHEQMRRTGRSDVWMRDRAEVEALFEDLELIEPGIVPVSEWRPEPGTDLPDRANVAIWGGAARKP